MRNRWRCLITLGAVLGSLALLGGGLGGDQAIGAEANPSPSQEILDFGRVSVGDTAQATYTYTLLQTSETDAWVTVYEPCSPFGISGLEQTSFVLAPGQSVSFSVTFSPAAAGSYGCSLRIVAQGGYPIQTIERVVPLAGEGAARQTGTSEPIGTPLTSPFTFLMPFVESPTASEQEWTSATTDSDGRFSVLLAPATTVSGQLRICEDGSLADESFSIAASEGGYLFTAPGYDVSEASVTGQLSLFGMTLADVGEVCLSRVPTVSQIELLTPGSGEALGQEAVRFCWTSLGRPDVTYDVVLVEPCDPAAMASRPHPFAPLIPDPQLGTDRRAARDARTEAAARETNWRTFCDELQDTLAQIQARRGEVEAELEQLRRGPARIDAADARDMVVPLPTSCSRSLEELFAPNVPGFDDIEPCEAGACEAFAERFRGLVERLQSLDADSFVAQLEFGRLLDRWERGAEHRGTMSLWADFYSAIDEAIGFITDALDALQPDAKAELESLARKYLLEENVAGLSPDQLEALKAADEAGTLARTALNLIKQIRTSGMPTPGFFVQMVQAMAQQASAAARVAVEGWDAFAAEMAGVLWDAYEGTLCTHEALMWLASQAEAIQDLCARCLDCQSDLVAAADEEVARAQAAESAAADARSEYWNQQRDDLAQGIDLALASSADSLFEACCSGGMGTVSFHVPGTSDCERQLEEALKQELGDRACFLEFDFQFSCDADGFSVTYSHSFPLVKRRPGCCVPSAERTTPVARASASGREGSPVCAPSTRAEQESAAAEADAAEDANWRVEARDQAGVLVAASAPRALGPGMVTVAPVLPIGPVVLSGCSCSVSVLINAIAWPTGGSCVVMVGAPTNVACGGDCGPLCAAGTTTVTITPPPLSFSGGGGVSLVPRFPVIGPPNQPVLYDFPYAGVYAVTATRACEDGATCSSTIRVTAVPPVGPVARRDPTGGECLSCPACGDSDCLRLSFRSDLEDPPIPVADHRLAVDVSETLYLTLESECRRECPGLRHVRWEVIEPSGAFDVTEGDDLYEIDYSFGEPGAYLFCVIETVSCSEGTSESERWLIVNAGESG